MGLPGYDAELHSQPRALFLCHQRDGCLCAGCVQTHGAENLLALRIHEVDPSVFGYTSNVPTFATGVEAALHGLQDICNPGPKARAMIAGLTKSRNGFASTDSPKERH